MKKSLEATNLSVERDSHKNKRKEKENEDEEFNPDLFSTGNNHNQPKSTNNGNANGNNKPAPAGNNKPPAGGNSGNSANSSTSGSSASKTIKVEEGSFANLVTIEKPPGLCKTEDKKFKMPGDKMKLPADYNVYGPPFKKPNNYMQETEKLDQISYFFDYIDDVLQKDISGSFKQLIEDAKKIPEEDPKNFEDPYSTEKLLFYWSHGQEGRDPMNADGTPKPVEPTKLKQYKPDFDPVAWSNSFSAGKISNIIKAFGWSGVRPQPFFFKRLIDKYDFDGNGRLDAREFLFYAIWENYKNFEQCKKHCFKDVILKKINPLFTFFDCDSDGYVDSENLWEGLRYLKRSKDNYDFYKCEVPKAFNKFYRTHAPNDFVLKNYDVADGYLNREEFRKGILLGYWERQAKANTVVNDDSINKKAERWDSTGMKDKDCDELLMMYDKRK